MVQLREYFNMDTIQFTNNYAKHDEKIREYYAGYIEGKLESMYFLGYTFARDRHEDEEIRVGVGWLLKTVVAFEKSDYVPKEMGPDVKGPSDYEVYFMAKRSLYAIFLPRSQYSTSILKENTKYVIQDNIIFGLNQLINCIDSEYVRPEDYLKMSLLYYEGECFEHNMNKAREYLSDALILDEKEHTLPAKFVDYFELLLKMGK